MSDAPANSDTLSTQVGDLPALDTSTRRISLERLEAAAVRVLDQWPDVTALDLKDREMLVREMDRRVAQDDWGECRLSLVCEAARAVFDADHRDRSELQALRNFYYDETAVTNREVLLSSMVTAFFESFVPDAHHTSRLAQVLRHAQDRIPRRSKLLFQELPELLRDPKAGVEALAQRMEIADDPYQEIQRVGIRAPHAPGLMDYVHRRYVDLVQPKLAAENPADQLLNWLQPGGMPARRSGAAEAITALIDPWTQKDPPPERRSLLTSKLVDMYGDPRRNTGDPWHLVGSQERAVFLRWLTGEVLHLLFDAITDTNDSHMWAERRRFYLELHRQKRIDEAWVAFAPAGAAQARRILLRKGRGSGIEFGSQVATGSRNNTSLLLARIGSKIVVDGSHSYKVHIFQMDDPKAPRLRDFRYDCEKIRRSLPESSKRAHLGDWQSWVLHRI